MGRSPGRRSRSGVIAHGELMVRKQVDLIFVVACSLALTGVILALPFAREARVALGLPFILFFPGYALIASLYPREGDLDASERIALSLGLSIAIVPLIGLALNYSPWGIRLYPIVAFVTLFIVLMAVGAAVRRWLLPPNEAFGITIRARWRWPRARLATALLSLGLVPLAAAVAVAGYFLIMSQGSAETFTEFYLLGPGGRAEAYPDLVVVGASAPVILGLANYEGQETAYRVETKIDGRDAYPIDGLVLEDGERWERVVSLVPTHAGDDQKVEFFLYRDGVGEPYRSLHLWLDVEGAQREAFVAEVRPSPTPTPSPTPASPPPTEVLTEEEVPAPAEEPPPVPEPPQPQLHVVVPGQYLLLIAGLYGVSLEALITSNDVENPDLIFPQQEILIPAGSGE